LIKRGWSGVFGKTAEGLVDARLSGFKSKTSSDEDRKTATLK